MKIILDFKTFEANNYGIGSKYHYDKYGFVGSGEEKFNSEDFATDWAIRKANNPVDRAQDNYYMKCKRRLEKKLGRTASDSEVTKEFDKGWMKNREKLVRDEQLIMQGRTKNWQKSDKLHDVNNKTGMFEALNITTLYTRIERAKNLVASSGGNQYTYKEAAHTPLNLKNLLNSYLNKNDANELIEQLNNLPIIELDVTLEDLSTEEDYKSYDYDTAIVKIENNWFICFSRGYDYWRCIYGVTEVESIVNNIDLKIASQKSLKGLEKTGVFN